MSFVIGNWNALVEEKNKRSLARDNFICDVLKGIVENSWSIC